MFWLVMLAKVLARAVKASFHRGDTGVESFSDFGVTAAFLHQREERTILRPQLRESVTQRIELLRAHRAGWLRNVFVFLAKWKKYPPKFLPPQLIDARVAGQPEKPRLELRRRLQSIDGSDHLDEDLLGEIFDVITSTGHGVNEAGNPMLIADDEVSLGVFVALLSPPYQVGQRSR
jgi:hypothetical protein